mgnify:CR=1 FL=1
MCRALVLGVVAGDALPEQHLGADTQATVEGGATCAQRLSHGDGIAWTGFRRHICPLGSWPEPWAAFPPQTGPLSCNAGQDNAAAGELQCIEAFSNERSFLGRPDFHRCLHNSEFWRFSELDEASYFHRRDLIWCWSWLFLFINVLTLSGQFLESP